MKHKTKEGYDLTCKVCNKNFAHLGSHIYHKHKITAREYKTEYGLPYNMSLISNEIYEKKSTHFEENKEIYLKNLFLSGDKYRFKKGRSGHRRISETEREKIINRITKVNIKNTKYKPCPVCKIKFQHIESHLYNKHKLLSV